MAVTVDPGNPYVMAALRAGFGMSDIYKVLQANPNDYSRLPAMLGFQIGAGGSTPANPQSPYVNAAKQAGYSGYDIERFLANNPNDYARMPQALGFKMPSGVNEGIDRTATSTPMSDGTVMVAETPGHQPAPYSPTPMPAPTAPTGYAGNPNDMVMRPEPSQPDNLAEPYLNAGRQAGFSNAELQGFLKSNPGDYQRMPKAFGYSMEPTTTRKKNPLSGV
jgi:hypothetical protein